MMLNSDKYSTVAPWPSAITTGHVWDGWAMNPHRLNMRSTVINETLAKISTSPQHTE